MTYDIVGIGLGPFNLGLAALCHDIPLLTTAFIEQKDNFDWHPGLILPGARLQVPFYADLVTLVHPHSQFSWFSFLQAKRRLFRFGVQDNPFPLRKEYNEYGQWVASQLKGIHFGHRCQEITYEEGTETYIIKVWEIKTSQVKTFHAKHLVIGIGTQPYLPPPAKEFVQQNEQVPSVLHAADYLYHRDRFLQTKRVTVIGSGQSAAEVFQDLLSNGWMDSLHWFTRSARFFPMETTPAAFELASPDYRRYFYRLPTAMKEFVLAGQDALYKGINATLLTSIYEQLYERSLECPAPDIALHPNCALVDVHNADPDLKELSCSFQHKETGETFDHRTDAIVCATGYQPTPLTLLDPVRHRLNYGPSGELDLSANYAVTSDQTIFLQNADLHSHGFASADLSFGPYRNAVILNTILGYDHFRLEQHTTNQKFGPPGS